MRSIRNHIFTFLSAAALMTVVASGAVAQVKSPRGPIIGGIVNGKALDLPKPEYPEAAQAAKLAGKVEVKVLIDESGKVISAEAISGLENASLRAAAEAAALKATFSPTKLSGEPVKVSGVIVYNFVLNENNREKLKLLALSCALSMVRGFASDLDKFKALIEDKNLLKGISSEFPDLAPDLRPLESLEKLTAERRIEVIDSTLASVRNKSNESGRWQLDLGKSLGEIIVGMMRLMDMADPDISKIDLPTTKLGLNRIHALTTSATPDFPLAVLEKLKSLAELENKDLSKVENLDDFAHRFEALMDAIDPEPGR